MGAGAAGCAMDPPRLLLLLLGVSASRRRARSLSRTGTLGVQVSPRENRTKRWAPRCWGWMAGEELRCQGSRRSV